ncbi:hypothetical protein HPB48_011436 [Haemaphysalis longicornis]|uniref:Uncharacterized protein n=1 Tax=Haemaphysalis longicornis TaxID=44386 RepID=A0A9J6GLC9_HAELO|nr:hypothetical protein HPB48_011436 [Haemaphysalis longicornis]
MRGQGYAGAAVTRGSFRGVQALIREVYLLAVYTQCCSHSLILCLNDASKVSDIPDAFATIGEVCTYFRSSSKRTGVLKKDLESSSRTVSRLHKYCETRWVEWHEAVILFSEALPDIVESLEALMESETGRNATASTLHTHLCSFNFLVSVAVIERSLSLTLRLSQYLQGNFVDMSVALEHIDLVLKQLSDIRKYANDKFKKIFDSCQATARGSAIKPEIPRKLG